jgi:16S rRNA (uracil1498-N3)-methyltransferase
MKEGEPLEVCDGRGCTAAAEWLNSQNKHGSLVRITSEVITAPRESWEWTVAVACGSLKGGRGDWLVEKAAELGATTLLPLLTTRSPSIAGSDKNDSSSRGGGGGSSSSGGKSSKSSKRKQGGEGTTDEDGSGSGAAAGGREGRWHRVSLAAMKQCLRSRAMDIKSPCTIHDLCSNFLKEKEITVAWVGTEGAPPIEQRAKDLLDTLKTGNNSNVEQKTRHGVLIIGPEGDFTADELELMVEAGVHGVGLGPSRLRTETAAIAMLSYARFAVNI